MPPTFHAIGRTANALIPRAPRPTGPPLRVVEQVPYCGDCDNLIGRPSAPYVRLHYIGYLPWTRGCALGGCYGAYNDYGCYWREVPVADGRGGWVRSIERFCNGVLLSER